MTWPASSSPAFSANQTIPCLSNQAETSSPACFCPPQPAFFALLHRLLGLATVEQARPPDAPGPSSSIPRGCSFCGIAYHQSGSSVVPASISGLVQGPDKIHFPSV